MSAPKPRRPFLTAVLVGTIAVAAAGCRQNVVLVVRFIERGDGGTAVSGGPAILVVDDADGRRLFRVTLDAAGYAVIQGSIDFTDYHPPNLFGGTRGVAAQCDFTLPNTGLENPLLVRAVCPLDGVWRARRGWLSGHVPADVFQHLPQPPVSSSETLPPDAR